jgi:hypothetical protein
LVVNQWEIANTLIRISYDRPYCKIPGAVSDLWLWLLLIVNIIVGTWFRFIGCPNIVSASIISATGIVPQSPFKNLKILDLENTLVVEIQKGILLYSCHIVRKFLNIDTEHKTQKSQNVEARRR